MIKSLTVFPRADADAARKQRLTDIFQVCVRKTRQTIKRMADEPKAAPWAIDGNYFARKDDFYEIGNWTSSFFAAMALIAWRETEDEFFLNQVQRLAPYYREKVFIRHMDTHHDLGFLASLYSVALYKLTNGILHRKTGLRAAEVLSLRFNEKGNFIRAWGRIDEIESPIGNRFLKTDNMAIIDCLMNLPLLYWAYSETGNISYYHIAVSHANTVLKHFIRPDNSVIHALRFDLNSGKPAEIDNYCGADKDSYWARGAAWGIYGFALNYAYTGHKRYLDAASQLAKTFLQQLDDHGVPMWDFRMSPEKPRVRDASASAVTVCGIQLLAKLNAAEPELLAAKDRLLDRICEEDYINRNSDCLGILKSAYGDKPAYSSWGDYYLMEAIDTELHNGETFW